MNIKPLLDLPLLGQLLKLQMFSSDTEKPSQFIKLHYFRVLKSIWENKRNPYGQAGIISPFSGHECERTGESCSWSVASPNPGSGKPREK